MGHTQAATANRLLSRGLNKTMKISANSPKQKKKYIVPSVLFWAADLPRGFPYIETLLFPGFRWLLGRVWGPNLFGRSSESPTLQGTTLQVVPSVCALGRQAVNISAHLRHRTVRTALKASRTLRQLGGRSSKIRKIFARAEEGREGAFDPFGSD